MNIYIDAGCFDGDTVEQFRNWRKIAFPDKKAWEIYAFDPNPAFQDRWKVVEDEHTHFDLKAVWTGEGIMPFAIEGTTNPLGSTLMSGKKKIWDNSEKVNVQSFDFSNWLKQFKDDFVVVKMDIEGAEFPVLSKMMSDGTDKICDYLMVEFHPGKVVEYLTTDKFKLMDKLKERGVNLLEWH